MAKRKSFWEHPISRVELQKPPMVSTDTSVVEAVKEMQRYRVGCVLITDDKGKLVGIMSHGDIMHDFVGSTLPGDVAVGQLMNEAPFTVTMNKTVKEVAEIFNTNRFRHLPVVKKGEVMGLLSVRSLMNYIGENLPVEVLNLPPSSIIASEQAGG